MKTRLFIKMVNGKRSTVNGFISVLRLQFTVLLIALAMTGCKKDDDQAAPHVYEDENAPPNAASKKAWVFGEQTWSDAIQCPECSKGTFEDSYTEPQCRSYTDAERGKTYYYYNWPYVDANADQLCPSPWQVPTKTDFELLFINTNIGTLRAQWGYTVILEGEGDYYWTSTEYTGDDPNHESGSAYIGWYYNNHTDVSYVGKSGAYRVRCVKRR
jgi:hypothetical protein